MANTIADLYLRRVGSAQEIANAMRIAQSTVYRVLYVRKVPLRYPAKSVAAQKKKPLVFNKEAEVVHLGVESAFPPQIGYEPTRERATKLELVRDAVALTDMPKSKKSRRKPKTLWQRITSLFK